jgi:N-acetylglucosaminyl-diphospho-decaprenol L-rhamnosyltransferase
VNGDRPQLSVVVLSYDRPACLRQALESLVAQPVESREILVVDNASTTRDEIAAVVTAFPEARFVPLPTNTGFTGGMNEGIARASGQHVLLTEDDVVLEPGCLPLLLEHARRAGERRVLAAVMLDHGTRRVRCAGGEVALGPPFKLKILCAGEDVGRTRAEPYDVSFVPGAFLLLPRAALDALHGFRWEFFMYFEDVELCLRARRLGIPITIVPAARVGHLPPAAAAPTPTIEFHKIKNLFATYLLHAPARVLPSVAARYVLLEGVRRARPGRIGPFLRACGWLLSHAPGLVRERRRLGRISGDAAAAPPGA